MLNKQKFYGLGEISQILRRAFTAICGKESDKSIDVDGCRKIGKRFVDFEESYNSLVWTLRAKSLVEGKMKKLEEREGGGTKMQVVEMVSAPVEAGEAPPDKKKRKREDGEAVVAAEGEGAEGGGKTKGEKKPKAKHYVLVGDLKWPAHPTTVHVTSLHPDADETDVSEVFKKCGELVKVRVLREKEFVNNKKVHTKSKGRALVQFIDAESVENALLYDDAISIKEKVIRVERSRLAAVEPVAGKPNAKKKAKKKGADEGKEGGGEKKKTPTIFKPRNVKKIVKKPVEKKPPAEKAWENLGKGKGNDGVAKGNSAFAAMFD